MAQTSDRTALNNKLFPSCTPASYSHVYLGRAVSSLSVDIARVEVPNVSKGSEDAARCPSRLCVSVDVDKTLRNP